MTDNDSRRRLRLRASDSSSRLERHSYRSRCGGTAPAAWSFGSAETSSAVDITARDAPTHTPSLRVPALVLSLAVAVMATSCGLPVDGQANALEADQYRDLIEGAETEDEEVLVNPDEDTRTIDLYFVTPENRLIRVRREVANATVNQALTALTNGPLAEEIEEFGPMESALTSDLAPEGRPREEGSQVLSVDVAEDLDELAQSRPDRARLLVSQIVCTITDMAFDPPFTGIRFFDPQGEVLGLLDSNSQSIEGPAEPADFNDCKTAEDLEAEASEAEGQEAEDGSDTQSDG